MPAGLAVIVVSLVGNPDLPLQRAINREEGGWLDWYIKKLSRWPGTSHVVSLPAAIDQLSHEPDLTRELVSRSTWELIEINATERPETLVKTVERRLSALLPNLK